MDQISLLSEMIVYDPKVGASNGFFFQTLAKLNKKFSHRQLM